MSLIDKFSPGFLKRKIKSEEGDSPQVERINSILKSMETYDFQAEPQIKLTDENKLEQFFSHGVLLNRANDDWYEFDFVPLGIDADISGFEGYNQKIAVFMLKLLFSGLINLDEFLKSSELLDENVMIFGETVPTFAKILQRFGLKGAVSETNEALTDFELSVEDFYQLMEKVKTSKILSRIIKK